MLEGLVFLLIGLQLPAIVADLHGYTTNQLLLYSVTVSVVTILIRILWVFFSTYYPRLLGWSTASDTDDRATAVDWRNVLIVAWTGTRGVLSLATALALPLTLSSGQGFVQRPLILFLSFVVILVTLVLQGMSLPLLIRLLGLPPQTDQARTDQALELLLASRSLAYLENDFPLDLRGELKQTLVRRYRALVHELDATLYQTYSAPDLVTDQGLVNQQWAAERALGHYQQTLLVALATEKHFSDEVLRTAERRIDLAMARLDASEQAAPG
ncbi:hypothetical protein HH216_24390 (plasmid) [Spirosoma rhododendri]|uniref:Cation/H+ exchanger domain-containing protein n=1 Tax=Spirosoma rhododendri TaxID=2728024 RepID=A0A7L5DTQ3_9BACT|nr:hypothetical protein HH216_24390 [Spirosoma rhododendri]